MRFVKEQTYTGCVCTVCNTMGRHAEILSHSVVCVWVSVWVYHVQTYRAQSTQTHIAYMPYIDVVFKCHQ